MRKASERNGARLLGRRARITYPEAEDDAAVEGEIVAYGNPVVVVELDRPLNPSDGVVVDRVVRRRSDVEILWE